MFFSNNLGLERKLKKDLPNEGLNESRVEPFVSNCLNMLTINILIYN